LVLLHAVNKIITANTMVYLFFIMLLCTLTAKEKICLFKKRLIFALFSNCK
jgi:hypothetical protein